MNLVRRDLLRFTAAMAAATFVPFRGTAAAAEEDGLDGIVSLNDLEPRARERVSHLAYEYIAGGAADEITLRWNREAYDHIRLRPRVLVDVSRIDTGVRVVGQDLAFPILLAPTAYHRLIHPEGERATARGAGAAGATLVVSSFATTAVEDVAAAATQPLWFQLYVQRDRGFTRDLVARAEAAGCRALCVTVDTPVLGPRDREAKAHFALPPGMERPNLAGSKAVGGAGDVRAHRPAEGEIYSTVLDPTLTWKEIEWLLSVARVPVLLKGILNPEDADRAARAGVAGIIVSNHGARNLDTAPATIDALPRVVDAVAGRAAVLVDGGIRRGTDVVKALALGASSVLIGRPYLYGLGLGGAAGVAKAVRILRTELEMAMALLGRPTIRDIDRGVLWT
ncbi:MAG TPA: alpha-hydroxy acid oxidase [Vicinamibacteria bacterium]|jgi:4-hydroxymandelate oxidase